MYLRFGKEGHTEWVWGRDIFFSIRFIILPVKLGMQKIDGLKGGHRRVALHIDTSVIAMMTYHVIIKIITIEIRDLEQDQTRVGILI